MQNVTHTAKYTASVVNAGARAELKSYAAIVVHALLDGKSNERGYATNLRRTLMAETAILDFTKDEWLALTESQRDEAKGKYESRFKKLCDKGVAIAGKAAEFGLDTTAIHATTQADAVKAVFAWLTGPVINVQDVQTLWERFGFASTRKAGSKPEVATLTQPEQSSEQTNQPEQPNDQPQQGTVRDYASEVIATLDAYAGSAPDAITVEALMAIKAHCDKLLALATTPAAELMAA